MIGVWEFAIILKLIEFKNGWLLGKWVERHWNRSLYEEASQKKGDYYKQERLWDFFAIVFYDTLECEI